MEPNVVFDRFGGEILAERGNEPNELIPASSLSAMTWGGRGWHVILRAERYTAAVAWMAYSAECRIVAKKKKVASTHFSSAV